VDDIAAAAGVSRRTFFRYFPSKADVLWVETPAETAALQDHLAASPSSEPYAVGLTRAVCAALDHPADQHDWALHRAQLIFSVPAVQAQTWQRFLGWREITSGFASARCGEPLEGLFCVAVGHAVIAATLTAHQFWIAHPDSDLLRWLREAMVLHLPPDPAGA